jgi:hypothetical protein
MVLFFHTRKLVGWRVLAEALRCSRLYVLAIAIVPTENVSSPQARYTRSLVHDALFECVVTQPKDGPSIAYAPDSEEARELSAVALAVAEATRAGDADCFNDLYSSIKQRLGIDGELIL